MLRRRTEIGLSLAILCGLGVASADDLLPTADVPVAVQESVSEPESAPAAQQIIIAEPDGPPESVLEPLTADETESAVASEPIVASEPALAPEPVAAPEPEIAPEPARAPEQTVEPKRSVAGQPTIEEQPPVAPQQASILEPRTARETQSVLEPRPASEPVVTRRSEVVQAPAPITTRKPPIERIRTAPPPEFLIYQRAAYMAHQRLERMEGRKWAGISTARPHVPRTAFSTDLNAGMLPTWDWHYRLDNYRGW